MSLASGWDYDANDSGLALFTSSMKASGLDAPSGSTVLEIGCSEAAGFSHYVALWVRPC